MNTETTSNSTGVVLDYLC